MAGGLRCRMVTAPRQLRCRQRTYRPRSEREFVFSEADFQTLIQLAYEHAGIALAESKRNLVYSRLSRRLRTLGLKFVSRISRVSRCTNDVGRTRRLHQRDLDEPHQVFPQSPSFRPFPRARRRAVRSGGARERAAAVFGSGRPDARPARSHTPLRSCSSVKFATSSRHDVRILATDIDTEVLDKAARGEYPANALDEIPTGLSGVFPAPAASQRAENRHRRYALQSLIAFRRLNLMEPWPFQRHVRCHLLPQRHDLFRRSDQSEAGRALHPATSSRAAGCISAIPNR